MSSDEAHESSPTDGTDRHRTAPVSRVGRELADGLHRLAIQAGQLEELVRQAGGVDRVDHDTRLAVDQAHSNASAIVATLGRAGFG